MPEIPGGPEMPSDISLKMKVSIPDIKSDWTMDTTV